MLKIRLYGDPVLRKVAQKIEVGSLNDDFIKEMSETMYTEDGVGLAAPQVGISKRFFMYDTGEKLNVVINPEILEKSIETEMGEEGCLSVPDVFEEVRRATRIKVRYFERDGQEIVKILEGYEARVFQHEFDHLNGKLFIDYLSQAKKRLLRQKLNEIKKRSAEILKEIQKTTARK